MSSTNRSDARNEHVSDYYVTPIKSILDFLNEFKKDEPNLFNKDIKILDPCAGGDSLHTMSYPEALKQIGISSNNIETIDIREDSLANIKNNYLHMNCKNQYDLIITNPPFNISLDIIQKSINDVKLNGYVIMLLRLNYFGGKLRKQFWEDNLAKYAYVHSKRLSFSDKGGTDSIEYMHCVWHKTENNIKDNFVKLKII